MQKLEVEKMQIMMSLVSNCKELKHTDIRTKANF